MVLVGQVEVSAVITEQSVSHEAPVVRKAQGMGSVAHESIYFGSLLTKKNGNNQMKYPDENNILIHL